MSLTVSNLYFACYSLKFDWKEPDIFLFYFIMKYYIVYARQYLSIEF